MHWLLVKPLIEAFAAMGFKWAIGKTAELKKKVDDKIDEDFQANDDYVSDKTKDV